MAKVRIKIVDCFVKHDEVHLIIQDEKEEYEIVFPPTFKKDEIVETLRERYKRLYAQPIRASAPFKAGETLELEV